MFQSSIIAVAMIIEREDKILLGKRADDRDFASGIWELPAGRVEIGEALSDAIKREANEELGIDITSQQIVDAYQFLRNDIPMILLTYRCTFKGDISKSDEHKTLEWVLPEMAIERFQFEQQKETIRKYIRLR